MSHFIYDVHLAVCDAAYAVEGTEVRICIGSNAGIWAGIQIGAMVWNTLIPLGIQHFAHLLNENIV